MNTTFALLMMDSATLIFLCLLILIPIAAALIGGIYGYAVARKRYLGDARRLYGALEELNDSGALAVAGRNVKDADDKNPIKSSIDNARVVMMDCYYLDRRAT